MKKITLISCLTLLVCSAVSAQKYIPAIKVGTVMNYEAYLRNAGQRIPITLTIKNIGDPTDIQWDVQGLGTGVFEVPAKAQESGTKLVVREPASGNVTKMHDDETFVTVSKAVFASMAASQPFELNGMKFTVVANDTTVYKINDKVTSIIHAVSGNSKSELWVLNNPDFPLICGETMVARGIDLTLLSIKE
jgi:hypothetical protein